MLTRLQLLANAVSDLGIGAALHVEHDGKRLNWRLCGTDPGTPSPVNASGCANDEEGAIRDIIAAAHEQLWEGISLELPEPDEHKFPVSLDEKMSDYAPVEEALSTDDLLASARENPMAAEQTVQRLDRLKRKKFFELLNVELAELQQERGGPRENLKRESEIESLLGLFARVGEM